MEQHLQTQAYSFDRIFRYSLYAALISFALMFASTLLIGNIHPLWNAILVIGFPYSLFVSKIKTSGDNMIFEENHIVLNGNRIDFQDIDSYHLFDSLKLYFVLRIRLKAGRQHIHYLPVEIKQDVEKYFDKAEVRSDKRSFDFIARYFILLYVLPFFTFLGLAYSLGTRLYYFLQY
ncbi:MULTISPECIES: hypothetical protein [Sphingobacterium]|uniref:hypothetical protein n=1 Tax=Sphingobacterium TaxID=28453 RepID=UPI00257E3746|nr:MULTISPECIES: hypothetical protein [Sphingobacterium]